MTGELVAVPEFTLLPLMVANSGDRAGMRFLGCRSRLSA